MYSTIIMILGFGMYSIAQFCIRFPKMETVELPKSNPASEVTLSTSQMTPFYETVTQLTLPGLTIAIFGILLFAISFNKTPNNTLNKDATPVAPIS